MEMPNSSRAVIAEAARPATPEATAAAFLDAFKQMDKARFDHFFAPEVTMFFPDGPFPTARVEDREAVLAAFHSFFVGVRNSGATRLGITPLNQHVQTMGDIAIVTFCLDGGDTVGRRTIIFRRLADEWRIVHFHASTAER